MSANSDITLKGNQVVVDAWDLCLHSSDPDRNHGGGQYRRALVHDSNDGLTVNWGNDYSGGVTLNGVKEISGNHIQMNGGLDCKGMLRLIGNPLNWTALHTDDTNRLVIESQGAQAKGILIKGPVKFEGPLSLSKPYSRAVIDIPDLVEEIVNLKNEIGLLKDRIAKLENP
jgi:hypothetical protein